MLQAIHLHLQHTRLAAIPAIANDQHHSATPQHPPGPLLVKEVQRIAYPCSARPVLHRLGNVAHRIINIAPLELARNPRQPRPKNKRLHIHQPVRDGVNEMQ